MTETLKFVGVAVVGVVVGLLLTGQFGESDLGGVYSNVTHDFSQGISVDGTTIIDGRGNITSSGGDVVIGASGATGCITMRDSDDGGVSYVTVLNGTLTATSTVSCQ